MEGKGEGTVLDPLLQAEEGAYDGEAVEATIVEKKTMPAWYYEYRGHMFEWVHGVADTWFEFFSLLLVMLNVVAFMLSTTDLYDKYTNYFESFELGSVIFFTFEYILRFWTCVEYPEYATGRFRRLRFAGTFFMLVDLLAILPYYIMLLPGVQDTNFTTAIRAVRLIRLLKAEKYMKAFALMGAVLKENQELFVATGVYAVGILVLFSSLLYFSEKDGPAADQFQSIPASVYLVLLMLTGSIDNSVMEYTPMGRFLVAIIALVGVAVFAVPTGILGSGFVKAIEKAEGKELTVDI